MIDEVFEWDPIKSEYNSWKHQVSFEEATTAFLDPKRIIAEDLKHSHYEPRYFCFGKVDHEVVTVRFTYRDVKIRIYGAGYWREGKKIYEKENN